MLSRVHDAREERKPLVVLRFSVLLIAVVAVLAVRGAPLWIFLAVAVAATAVPFFAWPERRWLRQRKRRTKR